MVTHTIGFALAWDSFPPLSSPNPCIITTLSLSFSVCPAVEWVKEIRRLFGACARGNTPLLSLSLSLSFSFSLSKRANWIYDDGTEARISLGRPSVPPPTR